MKRIQQGFTLIELVVVIVILGILAAVAAPKFIDISSDAHVAKLNAMAGSMKSANAFIRSKAIIAGNDSGDSSVVADGTTINTTDGYVDPVVADVLAALDADITTLTNISDNFSSDYAIWQAPAATAGVYLLSQPDTSSSFGCIFNYRLDASNKPVYSVDGSGC
ncbi:type II secretion system protein [uncultured Ferrimonas sp.]|uniref:pilin n=1 Tax=uncultured Ferrimonas sp. TaxID=432640 RepID=UPI0026248DB4|nr:type II secretion system protein [uncultured Ferrimonas sp.]